MTCTCITGEYLAWFHLAQFTSLSELIFFKRLKKISAPLFAPNRIAKISISKQALSRLSQTHDKGWANSVKSSSSGCSTKQIAILSAATFQNVLNKRKFELHWSHQLIVSELMQGVHFLPWSQRTFPEPAAPPATRVQCFLVWLLAVESGRIWGWEPLYI